MGFCKFAPPGSTPTKPSHVIKPIECALVRLHGHKLPLPAAQFPNKPVKTFGNQAHIRCTDTSLIRVAAIHRTIDWFYDTNEAARTFHASGAERASPSGPDFEFRRGCWEDSERRVRLCFQPACSRDARAQRERSCTARSEPRRRSCRQRARPPSAQAPAAPGESS